MRLPCRVESDQEVRSISLCHVLPPDGNQEVLRARLAQSTLLSEEGVATPAVWPADKFWGRLTVSLASPPAVCICHITVSSQQGE